MTMRCGQSYRGIPPLITVNTTATGMDVLIHAVEVYVLTMATPTTDAAATKSKKIP